MRRTGMARYRRWRLAGIGFLGLVASGVAWAAWPDPAYGAAYQRWQTQHITAYEITTTRREWPTNPQGSTITLRVRDGGRTIEILGPQGVATPTPAEYEAYHSRTVEAMFADTKGVLAYPHTQIVTKLLATVTGVSPSQLAYSAEYDPTLGYPTRIAARHVPSPNIALYGAEWELRVTGFNVLYRAPP